MPQDMINFVANGDPTAIFNWRRFDHRITTSGQPTEDQCVKFKTLGITQVINLGLHSHEKALPDERATLAALGIAYHHIPVDFSAPSQADLERYRAVMAEMADETVHVHCIYNARVTAFICRHMQGEPKAEHAENMMDSIWRPGGVWAAFIGREDDSQKPDRYAGRDY